MRMRVWLSCHTPVIVHVRRHREGEKVATTMKGTVTLGAVLVITQVQVAKAADTCWVHTAFGETICKNSGCAWDGSKPVGKKCHTASGAPSCICTGGTAASPCTRSGEECSACNSLATHQLTSDKKCEYNLCHKYFKDHNVFSVADCDNYRPSDGTTCYAGGPSMVDPYSSTRPGINCMRNSAIAPTPVPTTTKTCTCTNGQKVDTCTDSSKPCKNCNAGFKLSSGTCQACAAATHHQTSGQFTGSSCTAHTSCTANQQQKTAPTATTDRVCECTAGYERKPGSNTCTKCAPTYFKAEAGDQACTLHRAPCPATVDQVEFTTPDHKTNRVCIRCDTLKGMYNGQPYNGQTVNCAAKQSVCHNNPKCASWKKLYKDSKCTCSAPAPAPAPAPASRR